VVAARPYELGEEVRWNLEIDGLDVYDVDLSVVEHAEVSGIMVVSMIRGSDEVVLGTWQTRRKPHGPAQLLTTLGALRARPSAS
jgi:hypothetical protein